MDRSRLKTTTGASLSEVLNEKVTSSEENGFSRRRVVAGVAWSVPVILMTVAAPPASASPGPMVPSSVAWGPVGAKTATGASGSLAIQGPTTFDIQTGTTYAGGSLSYTIVIKADKAEQNALVNVASISSAAGTGAPVAIKQGDKEASFAGTLTAAQGNQKVSVLLNGFTYTKPNKSGQYTYTATLSVGGIAPSVVSTLTITFP